MTFSKNLIKEYSQKYENRVRGKTDELYEKELKDWFQKNRFLDKENFVKLGRWKSKRPTKNYEKNDGEFIKEITSFALSTVNEEARIKSLLSLTGVSWPVASVILHFAFPDKYPIMDFRAIWSLGWEQPKNYNFEFWKRYCDQIKRMSMELGVDIRTLDKALWQYSAENQK
jgi:hypothetical protein